MTKTRRDTDWESKLAEDETFEKHEGGKSIPVVLLRGLQRLAEDAEIISSSCIILSPSPSLIQCVYTTKFSDGTSWDGAADCHSGNCKDPYLNFPTAVAESRAEARSLRKALGIRMLSAEEISFEGGSNLEASPNKPVASSVVAGMERLCEERGVDKVELLEKVIGDKSRASTIFELKQLTTSEAAAAMSFLNSKTPVKKTSKRAARKEELLAAKTKDSK